jgi:hypothetical protein
MDVLGFVSVDGGDLENRGGSSRIGGVLHGFEAAALRRALAVADEADRGYRAEEEGASGGISERRIYPPSARQLNHHDVPLG